jgi:hypothetical protein
MKSIYTESILPPLSRISVHSFITLRSCNVVDLPDMKPNCFLLNNLFLFTESKFEESEVRKLLLGINPNKSPGLDGLHPKALKELTNVITEPLAIIFKLFSVLQYLI